DDGIRVRRLSGAEFAGASAQLSGVLIDCVEGGASVSFMAPMTEAKAAAFWNMVGEDVARGQRAVVVADDGERLGGTGQRVLAQPENQPQRADLVKLLVHRAARRRGVAERLMTAIEGVARDEGKTPLVLDTVTGGDGERLYTRLGWERVGVIPDYALFPDGRL